MNIKESLEKLGFGLLGNCRTYNCNVYVLSTSKHKMEITLLDNNQCYVRVRCLADNYTFRSIYSNTATLTFIGGLL